MSTICYTYFKFMEHRVYQGVKIKVLPDFFPAKMKSSGFAIWSTLFGLIYSMFHKFEICIADCGHRFTSLPCKLNRFIYHSVYISESIPFSTALSFIKVDNTTIASAFLLSLSSL